MSLTSDPSKEYRKNPELKKEDINSLMIWAEKQPHLPKITELQYILFLQSCYYSMQQAKQALDGFFTIRTICPEIFGNLDVTSESIKQAMSIALITCLPEKSLEGNDVIFIRFMNPDPEKYVYVEHVRLFDLVTMSHMYTNGTCKGLTIVMDMEGTVMGHLLKFNATVCKKYLFYLQEAMPIRLKQINIINANSLIDKLLALMKPFMKKELYEMIKIHPKNQPMDSFYNSVPQKNLPKEYGGDIGSVKELHEKEINRLNSLNDFIKSQEKQKVDNSKRVEKRKDVDSVFGLEGSFKKLDVD